MVAPDCSPLTSSDALHTSWFSRDARVNFSKWPLWPFSECGEHNVRVWPSVKDFASVCLAVTGMSGENFIDLCTVNSEFKTTFCCCSATKHLPPQSFQDQLRDLHAVFCSKIHQQKCPSPALLQDGASLDWRTHQNPCRHFSAQCHCLQDVIAAKHDSNDVRHINQREQVLRSSRTSSCEQVRSRQAVNNKSSGDPLHQELSSINFFDMIVNENFKTYKLNNDKEKRVPWEESTSKMLTSWVVSRMSYWFSDQQIKRVRQLINQGKDLHTGVLISDLTLEGLTNVLKTKEVWNLVQLISLKARLCANCYDNISSWWHLCFSTSCNRLQVDFYWFKLINGRFEALTLFQRLF